eukprot:14058075-Alexandrium_andersonii.AAC.1
MCIRDSSWGGSDPPPGPPQKSVSGAPTGLCRRHQRTLQRLIEALRRSESGTRSEILKVGSP